jgi:hypothetical protein
MQQDPSEKPKNPVGRPLGSYKRKLSLAEIDQLIQESIDLLLKKHYSHKQYLRFCRSKDLSAVQCNKYYKRTWDHIRSRFNLDRDKLVDKHLLNLWDLYDSALELNEINTARQVLTDIAKLQGLNEPEKIKIDNHIIELKFNVEDSSARLHADEEAN